MVMSFPGFFTACVASISVREFDEKAAINRKEEGVRGEKIVHIWDIGIKFHLIAVLV